MGAPMRRPNNEIPQPPAYRTGILWMSLFVAALSLAACRRAAQVPPSTPTPAASITPRPPTPTSTASSLPTATATAIPTGTAAGPSWGGTPAAPAERYTLGSWDAAAAWRVAQAQPSVYPTNEAGRGYNDPTWSEARQLILREIVARFPDARQHAEAQRVLQDPAALMDISVAHKVEPFRAALEAALSAAPGTVISTTTLTTFITSTLGLDSVGVVQVLPADNLLGDGAPGWVLEVRAGGYMYGTAVSLAGQPGAYHLVAPNEYWTFFSWNDQQVFATDLNANGQPEIAIWASHWGTGMSHFCVEGLAVYEWNGDGFEDLAPNIETSANTDSGDCLGFEFRPGPPGTPATIVTGNRIDTLCQSGDNWWAGSPIFERRYDWNGAYFSLASLELRPLEDSLPGGADDPCVLSWVNEAGASSEQALRLLPELLAQTQPTMTASFEDQFGPAYQDFFHLKLGMWSAFRGEVGQAIAQLTQVRDAPVRPEFDAAARTARAFLAEYPHRGLYAACRAANQVLDTAPFRNAGPLDEYVDLGAIRAAWGFSDWQWSHGHGSLWSGPTARRDMLNVCPLASAFESAVERSTATNATEFIAWLRDQGIPHTGLQEGDLNQDGRPDWLLLAETEAFQNLGLWAVLNTTAGRQVIWIADSGHTEDNLPVSWGVFRPDPSGEQINVYQWTDGMVFFRIISHLGWTGVEELRSPIGSPSNYLGFDRQLAEATGGEALKVWVAGRYPWERDWYTLGWDPAQHALQIVDSPQLAQDRQIEVAEDLLFEQKEPIQAGEVISQLLSLDTDLLDRQETVYGAFPTVRPRLLYLQGLAYEMNDRESEAVQVYWDLWRRYPLHPLSYLVQQKLIER